MKLLLILPIYQPGKVTPKEVSAPSRSLHIIAGLTPQEYDVKIVEEEFELADPDEQCDLVGISCMTSNITRGYQLAGEYRRRGRKVVMGGIHPSLLPGEALQHCDCVVIGEAENVWEKLLHDFKQNRLKKTYSEPYPELDRYLPLKTNRKNTDISLKSISIETTRGCPYKCNFCTGPFQFGPKQRHRPVDHVVKEIEESGVRQVFFTDDNIFGDVLYARELLKAITKLKISWGGQSTVKVFQKHPEFLPLAGNSGCVGLFFGIESVSPAMNTFSKSFKNTKILSEILKRITEEGLHVHTGIIFGFDEDTEGVFDETLEFLSKNKVGSASFSPLIPYPGTEIAKQFEQEGRLLSKNWQDYHSFWGTVVYKPKNFTPEKLYLETARVKKEFSGFSSTLSRFWVNRKHPLLHVLFNYGLNKSSKQSLDHWRKQYGGNSRIS